MMAAPAGAGQARNQTQRGRLDTTCCADALRLSGELNARDDLPGRKRRTTPATSHLASGAVPTGAVMLAGSAYARQRLARWHGMASAGRQTTRRGRPAGRTSASGICVCWCALLTGIRGAPGRTWRGDPRLRCLAGAWRRALRWPRRCAVRGNFVPRHGRIAGFAGSPPWVTPHPGRDRPGPGT